MPLDTSILNIYGYKITRIHGRKPLVYEARYIGKVNFPFCKSDDLRKKARFVRKLNHETIGLRRTELHLTARKYHCLSCKRYFNQRFPGILKYKRSTEAFRAEVFERHRKTAIPRAIFQRAWVLEQLRWKDGSMTILKEK